MIAAAVAFYRQAIYHPTPRPGNLQSRRVQFIAPTLVKTLPNVVVQ